MGYKKIVVVINKEKGQITAFLEKEPTERVKKGIENLKLKRLARVYPKNWVCRKIFYLLRKIGQVELSRKLPCKNWELDIFTVGIKKCCFKSYDEAVRYENEFIRKYTEKFLRN